MQWNFPLAENNASSENEFELGVMSTYVTKNSYILLCRNQEEFTKEEVLRKQNRKTLNT